MRKEASVLTVICNQASALEGRLFEREGPATLVGHLLSGKVYFSIDVIHK